VEHGLAIGQTNRINYLQFVCPSNLLLDGKVRMQAVSAVKGNRSRAE
jgi:hypothetical protein